MDGAENSWIGCTSLSILSAASSLSLFQSFASDVFTMQWSVILFEIWVIIATKTPVYVIKWIHTSIKIIFGFPSPHFTKTLCICLGIFSAYQQTLHMMPAFGCFIRMQSGILLIVKHFFCVVLQVHRLLRPSNVGMMLKAVHLYPC